MLETMKKEISEDIKKAYSVGKVDAQEIKTTVENAVYKVVKSAKHGAVDINEIAKEAVTTVVAELESANSATKEHIEAAVNGTIDGISKNLKDSVNKVDMELLKTKYRLQEQEENLATHLKDGLNGAKEAASNFSDEIKTDLEEAVTDTKLKSVEILGLLQATISQSVKSVIDEGTDVEAKIVHITKEATENALSTGRLSAKKVKEVSEVVILGAIETAQEAGKDVKEVTKGAIEGAKQGVAESVKKTKSKLLEAKNEAVDFVEEDIKQTIEDLEAIEDAFIETLRNIADRVGDIAETVIESSIKEIKEDASQLREIALDAAEVAIDYLKEKGSQVAYSAKEKALEVAEITKDEIVVLSEKMVKIGKGAFSGMIDGAKKALDKK